jgi:uncharacterized Ntn-hydrolase superfamily protein
MARNHRIPAARVVGLLFCGAAAACLATPRAPTASEAGIDGVPPVATFSIVAYDPDTQELGVAVQSRFLGVGAVVPWAKGGVGAVATQAYANTTYGPRGLELMANGRSAQEALDALLKDDEGRDRRQVGIVDAKGGVATYTGPRCDAWAGGTKGDHFCVQGNILAGADVVEGMAKGFEHSESQDLGERLIDALDGGQKAGGDKRGMQSAALLIVHEGWGYAGFNDRYRDVRVDDHEHPIDELRRIYHLHQQTFRKPRGR